MISGESEDKMIGSAGANVRSDLKRGIGGLRQAGFWFVAAACVIYVLSGFYVVQPEERGVVLRFGALEKNMVSSGIHYRLPYPIDRCYLVKVTEIKRVAVGFSIDGRSSVNAGEREVLTGDENVINVELLVQYSISNPAEYLFSIIDPGSLINKSARAALTSISGSLAVDDILTISKPAIQNEIRNRVQEELDQYACGIKILATHLQSVRPPQAVSDAFMDVASAREDRERYINEARGYRNNVIPQAKGEARRMIEEAEAYRTEVERKAVGDADRFCSLLEEYPRSRDVTELRLYIETMEQILPKMNKYIVNSDAEAEGVQMRYIEPVLR